MVQSSLRQMEGVPPFAYDWSNSATTPDLNDLCVGNYTLTLTDATNCEAVYSVDLEQPTQLTATAITVSVSSPGAMDGSVNLTISGGTAPFTYLWSNNSLNEDIDNLSPGTYCVTVTDAESCTETNCWEVEQVDCVLTVSYTLVENPCQVDCIGAIDISATGDNAPFTYNWSNGANTEDLIDLCNDLYIVTVTNNLGCTVVEMITLSGPDTMVNEATYQNATCFSFCDGAIQINTVSGTDPLTYDWSVNVLDGMTDVDSLCAGSYDLTITDGNGCTELLCFEVSESDEIMIQITTSGVCFGECNANVTFSAAGGTGSYSFVTDAPPPFEICAGVYGLTVTDALGCFESTSFEIFESPEIMYTLVDIINETDGQGNGSIVLDASGGTAPLSFNWSLNGNTVSTAEDPTGLGAGNYTLTITGSDGCFVSMSGIIIENLVATSEQYTNGSLLAFPNPSDDLVFIHLDERVIGNVDIAVFDMSGKELDPKLISRKGELQWILDVSPLGRWGVHLACK